MGIIQRGEPSPLRYVPPGYLAKRQGPECVVAGIMAIKPRRGAWEAYTSWDAPLSCPAYIDEQGNYTPPLTYQPCRVEITNIPTQLQLGSQAADVKVFAPRGIEVLSGMGLPEISTLFLDRSKLLKLYYAGAYWEYREIDPDEPGEAMAWLCGEIGSVDIDDLGATIELSTYDELANRKVGDVYHLICQHGARIGEKFGEGRCEGPVMHDGPKRPDWTVAAAVGASSTKREVFLTFGSVARSGNALDAAFTSHLANGDLEFYDEPDGGLNSLFECPIRGGEVVSDFGGTKTVKVWPKTSLPYTPEAGNQLWLVAGCRRHKPDCVYFHKGPPINMRSQDCPSNEELLSRSKT